MSASPIYDLVVLGSGPGGYVAAIRAGQLGLRAALVERDALGGVCLNRGCIPSKALIGNAEALSVVRRAEEFGIHIDGFRFDFAKAVDRSRGVVRRLQKGVEALLKKQRVEVIEGTGRFISPRVLQVEGLSGSRQVEGRNVIIACGTRVKPFPGIQPDGRRILTSDEALFLKSLPRSMAILGAGYTGVEFAYIFSVYGVEITLVEFMPQILPGEDAEAAAVIARQFKRGGIRLLTGTSVEEIRPEESGVAVAVKTGGEKSEIRAESVLVAMGRQPNSEALNLSAAGVETERGFVKTNPHMQTNVPHIYAIGDIAGKSLLAHSAMAEGVFVAERLAGRNAAPIDHRYIPRCTYCQPQLAAIGLTEEQARKAHSVKVGKFPLSANGKALAMGEREGFIKVITEAQSGQVLGAHMVGAGVAELISEVSLARLLDASGAEVRRAIHPHPTLSEALMEAAAAASDEAIHL